jgi:pimeloyl-ACP methyl ester carboxylesterase
VIYPSAPPAMSTSGVAFRHSEGSDPNLAPLVFLHGLSQQGDFWLPVIEALGSRYSTLSIDLRGHGESRNMAPDYRIATIRQDCLDLMDEVGLRSACVVGHSWGASVALNIAAQGSLDPLRSASCILIDGGAFTPANILEGGSLTRSELTAALTPPLGPFSEDELTAHYLPANISLSIEQQESVMSAIERSYVQANHGGRVTSIGFDRHMAVLDAFLDYNPDSDLKALAVPTWILMAREVFAPSLNGSIGGWADARSQVDKKVQGKMNIALQHWYGAVHDVPLYWPIRVSQLISHVVSSAPATKDLAANIGGKDGLT